MPIYTLDLQHHYKPWKVPTLPQVIISLRAKFSDPKLTVIPERKTHNAFFKIILDPNSEGALTIPLMVEGKEVEFPLTELKSGPNDARFSKRGKSS